MRSFLFSFLSSFSFAFSSMLSVRLVATKPEMTTAVENWTEQVRAGDMRAISRAVSAIENREPEAEEILRKLFPHTGKAYRVGITGAPGTGIIAPRKKASGLLQWIRPVRSPAARFSVTASACRDMPRTAEFLSGRWRRADF
jgi:hypothetical protein